MSEFKEVDTIKLTYAEAWEALKEGKEVFFHDSLCNLDGCDYICNGDGFKSTRPKFHPTDKLFTMKKEPEYEVLGLHDDYVEIEVFGLKTCVVRSKYNIFFISEDGSVWNGSSSRLIGRVKLKGDYTKAKIRVTVSNDKQVTYENL